MRTSTRAFLAVVSLLACAPDRVHRPAPRDAAARDAGLTDADRAAALAPDRALRPFGDVAALRQYLQLRAEQVARARGAAAGGTGPWLAASGTGMGGGGDGEGTMGMGGMGVMGHGSGAGTGAGMGSGGAPRAARYAIRHTGASPAAPGGAGARSITNNQVEGIDEGDIVKAHGDHLVVLRRGRLFTLRLGGDALAAVSQVNAWGEGQQPGGWYDEMLIDGDTVVVVGFNLRAGATELGLFDLDAAGGLRWRDTMFVRSSDYYSSRNYASRLVGHRLVMYLPVPLRLDGGDALHLPAVRRSRDGDWTTVVPFEHLYRPVQPLGSEPTLHTVMSCDLSRRGFACQAVGVAGPESRNFHVSGSAVYLWITGNGIEPWTAPGQIPSRDREAPPGVLYRFPLDCSAPGAARVRGAPVDQFSFDERGDALRVLLTAAGRGEGMWSAEAARDDVGLVTVPLGALTAAVPTVARSAYRGVGRLRGYASELHNRFVGDHVLFGGGSSYRRMDAPGPEPLPVFVHHVASGVTTELAAGFSVERIEPLGRDALVVGNQGSDLVFAAVNLDGTPALAGRHTVRGASQGETRSHGFFYAPSGDRAGMLGLPITRGDDRNWRRRQNSSSAVLFLAAEGLAFRELGSLGSAGGTGDDDCVASCADWYGNARPIFWQSRTFALLGYELVEGSLSAGGLRARRRVDFLRATVRAPGDAPAGNIFDALAP